MRKILLIKSTNLGPRNIGAPQPMGIMYLASYVINQRHDRVKILDSRIYKDPAKEFLKILYEFKPEVIGISALTVEAGYLHSIAQLTKSINKSIKIVVGGPYVTAIPETVVKDSNIDIGVIGEGEVTFKELMDAFEYNLPLNSIKGIIYKQNGNIIKTPDRPYIENVDELPFPAWDLIDMKKYYSLRGMGTIGIRPYMLLFTSRGCPFRCTYCHNIFGKRFRPRSVENVLQEMNLLMETYEINDFEIIDDISNFDRERIKSVLRSIIDRKWKIHLSFPNGVRTDMLDEEIVMLMKKAGTVEISIAVETISPRLQRMVKKNLNLEKVKKMISVCVDSGMFVRGFFMLGFPTETIEEMKATIDFACKSKLHEALFFKVNPFGGTELSDQVNKAGKFPHGAITDDHNYFSVPFNISNIPDKLFNILYAWAYIKFYFNVGRIIRILKRKLMWNDLPMLLWRVIVISFNAGNKHKGSKTIAIDLNDKKYAIVNDVKRHSTYKSQ